jgi:tetratricopeptide (TPR) repeat protein
MLFRPPSVAGRLCQALRNQSAWAAVALLAVAWRCGAADIDEGQKLFLSGKYEDCVTLAQESTTERPRDEDWPILLNRSLLTLGRYPGAELSISNALDRMPWSIRLRLAARDAYQQNGQPERAQELLQEINERATTRMRAYTDPPNIVAMGQAALLLGADARRVLDNFFNRVKKSDPSYRETYLAIGELALTKGDFELANKTYQEGLDRFADDTEMLYGLARSFSNGDRSQMLPLLEKVLEKNARHVPSLLLLADHLIDSEEYKKADELLDKVLAVNPHEPAAWAYRAVLAHLRTEPDNEKSARETALRFWKTNPSVDHLIGEKLSQKYRFTEGSSYQRRALAADRGYLPAKIQLAEDLLRLGKEDEGWSLAEDVYNQDGYDVLAYNLVTLHDNIAKFQVLSNADFRLRMQPQEAVIYGDRAMDLLERARRFLCKKYGMDLTNQTTVEVFPEQKDFAIRTFGMPGGEGYLGVCFGDVITANSPASHAASRINWQSVLWHEFCHVVTLGLTHNKMPRWLSEGISVYEERQCNPAWGQGMTPHYREMVLKGELTPVGNLSAAFLAPKTPMHLQFAYYESSLVVEFLVQQFGLESLKQVLHDLGEGKSINQAIESHTASLIQFEKDFAEFARQRAEQLGPGLDWAEPKPDDLAKEDTWISKHPRSRWGLTRDAKKLIAEKKWAEAKTPLNKLLELYPESVGPDNPYALLAEAERGLGETKEEHETLTKLARLSADSLEAYQRLMELDTDAGDWKGVTQNVERFLAVNPLVPQPYRFLARACEETGRAPDAIRAYRTLLLLDPPDPADLHFRLSKLLYQTGDPEAKRQVLQALEEAPRFRDAHKLLLQIAANQPEKNPEAAPTTPPPLPEIK